MKIGIIGAGLAGLACADALVAAGHDVRLFDKARGPGGRMSTRRAATDLGEAYFDHGAQYFTAKDARFHAVVQSWVDQGLAAIWPNAAPISDALAASAERWVGTPSMNTPIKAMAARHDVTWSVRVEAIARADTGWRLHCEGPSPADSFDQIVVAVPAEQTGPLLADHAPEFAAIADATFADPCWTLMLAFAAPLQTAHITIRDYGPIGWAARNSDKPGRTGPETWVVQAGPKWSRDHLEETPEQVMPALISALGDALGMAVPQPVLATAHRWRYARSGNAARTALYDPAAKIGVCGDWLLGPRVENAWLSGDALGQML